VHQAERKLAYARTCYSHLAGLLAVEIAEALQRREFIVRDGANRYRVTRSGRAWFEQIGIDISAAQLKRTRFARCCLDWTERRHHIAGDLGSVMLAKFRELKWIAPLRGTRAVRVTSEGEQQFWKLLAIRAAKP